MVMVMDGMRRVTYGPGVLARVRSLIDLCQDVPVQPDKCKQLAEHLSRLIPFLEEFSQIHQTDTERKLEMLLFALLRAETVLKKIISKSKVQRLFSHSQNVNEVSNATRAILACIDDLPMVQFRLSSEKEEEIRELKIRLQQVGEELKDVSSVNKDEVAFAAEFAELLRAQNTGEATTQRGGGRTMDHMLQWLAKRFDSDITTVTREWQEMKEEALGLREQLEYTADNKRKMEEGFLKHLVLYIEQLESAEKEKEQVLQRSAQLGQDQPENDASSSSDREVSLEDFNCPICLNVMVKPVVGATGHTFCMECIRKWYADEDTCPCTGEKLKSKILLDNILVRGLIAKMEDSPKIRRLPPRSLEHPKDALDSVSTYGTLTIEVHSPATGSSSHRSVEGDDGSPSGYGSKGVYKSLPSLPRSPSVETYIASLLSNKSLEILKSLKQLVSIASEVKGQLEILRAGGIPEISRCLKSSDSMIVEKAASVLDALTFEVQGDKVERLDYEDREALYGMVTDSALDSLIHIMQKGNYPTRVKAAQTVVNLLADDEIRHEVSRRSGVVTALYGLSNIEYGFMFTTEGKNLCIKALYLLSGDKAGGSHDDVALANALYRLAGLGATTQLVEESLVALSSMVELVPGVSTTLIRTHAIPFLVRCTYRSPRESWKVGGHSLSQSGMLSEKVRTDVLKILNVLSTNVDSQQVFLECQVESHLLPLIADPASGENLLEQATRFMQRFVLSGAIGSPVFFQLHMKGLVNFLTREQASSRSKVDVLTLLIHLCQESDTLRNSFFSSEGVAAFEDLAKSREVALRYRVSTLFRVLCEYHPSQKELRTRGAARLLNSLLADDQVHCRQEAVLAAEKLNEPGDWSIPFEEMPLEQVVDLLRPQYPSKYREAATSILWELVDRETSCPLVWDKKVVQLFLGIIREEVGAGAKRKAAEVLVNGSKQNHTICSYLEEEGLSILKAFGDQQGLEFRGLLVQLLRVFSQESDACRSNVLEVDGVTILHEALEMGRVKGKVKEEAALALRHLVTYLPARVAAIEAGFIERAIKCISGDPEGTRSSQLTETLLFILEKSREDNSRRRTVEKIRQSNGVHAFVLYMNIADVEGKRLAATALAKMMTFDSQSVIICAQVDGLTSLKELLVKEISEAESSAASLTRTEALQAILATIVAVRGLRDLNILERLLREGFVPALLSALAKACPKSEELALQAILELSRELLGRKEENPELWRTFIKENPGQQLLRVVHCDSASSPISIEYGIRIIRNISIYHEDAMASLLEEQIGVIPVLLSIIDRYDSDGSISVVELAVIALDRFMYDKKGRTSLINAHGIPLMVRILQKTPGPSPDAKKFITRILSLVADSNPQASTAVFDAGVVPCLQDILELGPKTETKKEAAILLRHLVEYGPRSAVCNAIRKHDCLPKLLDLRAEPEVTHEVQTTLKVLQKYDKEIKKEINNLEKDLKRDTSQQNWFRTVKNS